MKSVAAPSCTCPPKPRTIDSTAWPWKLTPLRLPRFFTSTPSGTSDTSAWRRETVASAMTRSQSSPEPITQLPCRSSWDAPAALRSTAPSGRGCSRTSGAVTSSKTGPGMTKG
jgi:hypothetical protein